MGGFHVVQGKEVRVAISGRSGCGNTTVSRLLAEILDIAFINYTFRSLSLETGMPLSEIIEKAKTDFTFDRQVDTRQVALAQEASCVLGSRLAIWMLEKADLTVYLIASEEVRAKRISNREGASIQETLSFTAMRDAEDTRRYRELYGIDNTNYSFADMVIDTEQKNPEEIVSDILQELEKRGLVARD